MATAGVHDRQRKPLRGRALSSQPPGFSPHVGAVHPAHRLQRLAGNAATVGLLAAIGGQAKLSVSSPDDVYEQEADQVASQVMRAVGLNNRAPEERHPAIQRLPAILRQVEEEEEEMLQPRSAEALPQVQLHSGAPAPEEVLQTRRSESLPQLQRQEEEEEEMQMRTADSIPPVQRMSEEAQEEEWIPARRQEAMPVLQRQEEEEWALPRRQDAIPTVQRQEEEELMWAREATPVPSSSSTPDATAAGAVSQDASSDISSRLDAGRGGGQAMDNQLLAGMSQAFGYDFGGVRVHTETSADDLAGRLSAEAFTHGSDVYFRSGRYQPDSESGRFLLAHELTHVIQQGAAEALDRDAEL